MAATRGDDVVLDRREMGWQDRHDLVLEDTRLVHVNLCGGVLDTIFNRVTATTLRF